MKDKLKDMAGRAVSAASKTASSAANAVSLVGDLNGDGKVDRADWDIARNRTKTVVDGVTEEAARLGKTVMRSDMTRDVAAGAAIGAAVAIPVPIVGPGIGAVAGAGIGLYKNLKRPAAAAAPEVAASGAPDLAGALSQLDDLRQRGILTDDEFQAEKRKLLRRS
jgi:hypothetical protein